MIDEPTEEDHVVPEDWSQVFSMYTQTSTIGVEQLQQIMAQLGVSVSGEELQLVFREADTVMYVNPPFP